MLLTNVTKKYAVLSVDVHGMFIHRCNNDVMLYRVDHRRIISTLNYFEWTLMDINCALGLYRPCNAQRTRTVFCCKELREKKIEARIGLFPGLKLAHICLFVVISCDKISERFYIGAKVIRL